MAKQGSGSGRLTTSTMMRSDMAYDLYCEICSEDGTYLEAEGFCVDCQDFLCRECVKGHRRTRMSRNHVLQDKNQMPHQKPSPSVSIPRTGALTEKCAHHPDRLIEYYCRDDSSLGCSVCITVKHRMCNSVDHIPDLAEQLLDSQEYKQFTNTLNTLKTKSQHVVKETKENVNKADKWFSDAENTLQQLRKKMNKAFDKFEMDLKHKANTIQSADLKKMQDFSDKGQTVLDEVKAISAELQSLENNNQLGQLFIYMIKIEGNVETMHALLSKADTENSVTAYIIEPGSQLQKILDDPSSIGTLSIKATDRPAAPQYSRICAYEYINTIPCNSVSSNSNFSLHRPRFYTPALTKTHSQPNAAQEAAITPSAKDLSIRAVFVRDIDVRTKRDAYQCWISGSVLLPGNKLVLVDFQNEKVKLVKLHTSTVTSQLDIPSGPWDITSITTDHVAVTLLKSKKIALVKVTDTLILNREVPVAGDCFAIVHNKGKLIVSFINPVKIEIMALNGKVERKIEQPGLFELPKHMSLNLDCKTLYVADWMSGFVKKMTLDGTVEAAYSDKQLNGPKGLIVDQHGRVIVCGKSSHNIQLLTSDLRKVKVPVDGLLYPESLSYCHSTGRLFVGMLDSYKMKVYQLA